VNDPFLGSEALASGVLRKHQLRSQYKAIYPDVYVRRDVEPTARERAVGGWLWSHRNGVLAGLTAAAWHGSKWVDEHLPIELIWSNARSPRGLRTYDMALVPDELDWVAGLPVTTPGRTAFDIGCRKPMGIAIAHLDALMRATGLEVDEISEIATRHRGARGAGAEETESGAGMRRRRFAVAEGDLAATLVGKSRFTTTGHPDPGDSRRGQSGLLPRHGVAGPHGGRRV